MSERARALEQALRELTAMVRGECPSLLNEDSGGNGDLSCQIEKLLAVDPPPSGAGPQAETSEPLNFGGFPVLLSDKCAPDTWALVQNPAPVSPVEPESPAEAQFGEYERLKRQAREIEKALREAGCPAMPLEQGVRWLADKDFTTPLPPRPPAVVKPHRYDLVRYGVTWEGQDNQPLLTPMPDGYWTPWHLAVEAPTVEPEPPTTCRCLDCEPLADPGPKPSEDDINRLEKAAWDSKTDRVLVWYRDRAEMFRQRLRETERAWQLDRKKPTVEPEPCVWRESGNRLTKAPCFDSPWFGRHAVAAWKVCPYCGAPLKVER